MIFGNNTNNRQMFSQLTEYTHLEFLQAHPIVQMDTLYRNADWKVFAVMAVSTLDAHPGNFEYDVNRFDDETAFLRFVSEIRDRSLFDTPTTVGEGGQPADAEHCGRGRIRVPGRPAGGRGAADAQR